jgi:hypothetical protein
METNDLIARLAAESTPVRRLPTPWLRGLLWLAISAPYVAMVVILGPMPSNLAPMSRDAQFLIEQAATLAIASRPSAAFTAPPGYTGGFYCCLVPFAAWSRLWARAACGLIKLGAPGLELRPDQLPVGGVDRHAGVAMVITQRGTFVPTREHRTRRACGGGATNFGLRLF